MSGVLGQIKKGIFSVNVIYLFLSRLPTRANLCKRGVFEGKGAPTRNCTTIFYILISVYKK